MKRDNLPWQTMAGPVSDPVYGGNADSVAVDNGPFRQDNGLPKVRNGLLAGNRLPERWAQHRLAHFVIAATGFDAGLDFLLTWQAWRAHRANAGANATLRRLHYLAMEPRPLSRAQLARAAAAWPELATLASELLAQYPSPLPGPHRLLLDEDSLVLDLWWCDVGQALDDLCHSRKTLVDAWYLGSSAATPDSVPGAKLARLSRSGATLATFATTGTIAETLGTAGFSVQSLPANGPIPERLCGKLTIAAPPMPLSGTPWDISQQAVPQPLRALVIGAGLAGCHSAAALARRGIPVTLLERGELAGEASGNGQGALYTRVSHRHSPVTDFALASFAHAVRQYRRAFRRGDLQQGEQGALCGSFHQVADAEQLKRMAPLLAAVPELAQVVDAATASTLLGVKQDHDGYWFPDSGWMQPAALCRQLVKHPLITLHSNCGSLQIQSAAQGWAAVSGSHTIATADIAVLAGGTTCTGFSGLEWLPLRPVRGQTTWLPPDAGFTALRAVLCHTGYVCPPIAAGQCIGATFDPGDTDPQLRNSDQTYNLRQLAGAVPAWADNLETMTAARLDGRVGWRCASPDYLPLVGPVPDRTAFALTYGALREDARCDIPIPGTYLPGLYVNTGHGSRGLTSTPLTAELIASQICEEPLPLEPELVRALSPARFLIRDLGRKRL
ncbi:bifunctional tRNA (5-methylaminomethyl-2-thiouridine)(34)-methyltransferase MnmD/FAD-dependent 5-carboxymethylaminomethyl-2-thiouridine(34) oxidoreductase MnmC [Kineobactrum sediminis]|uniref:tRNA 5-methylaminomethyl-2-thiouridine biosynthesis bifunctional protein MnmC n=1 Tax=Kineobactrum sediminis TaxID=1905677 RepID=A0A2N5Y323_9GAMM|nr:bifunctional tRNA (5-methylaminomethyl-2-thiouridine)(34)-methyltransferase MnmD/FAD-dependent 5-carboxymethylaminomethyl-2-thiouridine(34) oxidoreductase MnmC [Kineobactrum sediminis]PLW82767.1 bifunctional tRNA (5-methylaminomethyl-2-thiouridine)(34)-methyltransferase MnmD/FAD-dependent 5-carboxymethylaminomethyl-2-thiouridine(34) oxidoreductase MnmC [Kineobactrum sediminis]